MFIYLYAQPDQKSYPGMAGLVFLIGLSLITFQVKKLKKGKS
jgi:hypothetical protein